MRTARSQRFEKDGTRALPAARPVWRKEADAQIYFSPHPTSHLFLRVFSGGRAVFLPKPRSYHKVINDIDRGLVAFICNAKLHRDALLEELELVLGTRQKFEDYLAQPGLTELQREATRFGR